MTTNIVFSMKKNHEPYNIAETNLVEYSLKQNP